MLQLRTIALIGLVAAAFANIVVAGAAYVASRRHGGAHVTIVPHDYSDGELVAPDITPSLRVLLLTVSFGTAVSSFVYEIGLDLQRRYPWRRNTWIVGARGRR